MSGGGVSGFPGSIPTLPGADCVDLRGGKTSGVTEVAIYDWQPGNLARNFGDEAIVLIDVEGGESAAEHFVISPRSQHYDAGTGTVQSGFVMFPLVYDADRQQHKLVSLPGPRAWTLPHVAQGLQALARGVAMDAMAPEGVASTSGTWVRLSNRRQSRDVRHGVERYGRSITVDSSHDIDSTAFTVGRSWEAGGWRVGGAMSYVDAGIDFDATTMAAQANGASLALHAVHRGEALFFDNLVQLQWLEMDLGDPAMDTTSRGHYNMGYGYYFDPSTAYRNQTVDAATQTLHLRSELGWRLQVAEHLDVEPMVGASWVRSDIGDAALMGQDNSVPGYGFYGDAYDSLRATVGVRVSLESPGEGLRLRYTGSVRHWLSVKDETKVRVANAGPDLVVEDDFEGGWTELTAGVGLSSESGRISGELQAHGVFGAYEGFGVTAGLQLRW